MARTKNEKKAKPKRNKKPTPPHFVLEVHNSVIGQGAVIHPKENVNGNN
jgi:hypothetical protein